MLWYKAWLETRARFLISLFGIVALCSYSVFHGDREALPDTRIEYYYHVLHAGHRLLALVWVGAINLLLMGGLLREKAVGAAAFTLSLPVSRTRLMSVRILMGFFQAVTLAIIPWCAMFLIGATAGKTHSFSQAWFHLVLLAGGGLFFYAVALLISSMVEGEYTAPVVSYGIAIAIGVALSDRAFRTYSPWQFITGGGYWDRDAAQLVGPIPWMHFMVYALIAVSLIFISVKAIQRREF